VTIAIRPSDRDEVRDEYAKPNFGKVEYFRGRGLTRRLGVLPDGQHKVL
jgi:hypothetical protein